MTQLQPLVAGNWKMNGLKSALAEAETVAARLAEQGLSQPDVMICPPATLLPTFAGRFADTPLGIGAQDCHPEPSGAHTGDISAEMLADAGAQAVIVGHSERRADHKETDALVAAKAAAAHRAGLAAIVCVGETRAQREAGEALKVVADQLAGSLPPGVTAANTIIAYEPVWAIGTGLTPTTADIAEMHGHIRAALESALDKAEAARLRILYGGSVKPANAAELMAVDDVNGALVGGASLKADEFWGIISAYDHN